MRKAVKGKIPLITPAFLAACRANDKRVPHDPFVVDVNAVAAVAAHVAKAAESREAERAAEAEAGGAPDIEDFEAEVEGGEKEDLGCCCACHSGEAPLPCPWCPDC